MERFIGFRRLIWRSFFFWDCSEVIEAFCKAYLETDDLQFAYYAKDLMALEIKRIQEGTGDE